MEEFVERSGGSASLAIKKIVIAADGVVAVNFVEGVRRWTYAILGDGHAINCVVVARHSDVSKRAEHVRVADGYVSVPGSGDAQRIVDAAIRVDAQAVWIGGSFFTRDNATQLPDMLAKHGIAFIGPPSSASMLCVDVALAIVAQALGVPTVPWSGSGVIESLGSARPIRISQAAYDKAIIGSIGDGLEAAAKIGPPVFIKASRRMNDGTRSVRLCDDIAAFPTQFCQVESEAPQSPIFVQKAVDSARCIQVQLVADRHGNATTLLTQECWKRQGERKASVMESPTTTVPDQLIKQMQADALRYIKMIEYEGVATASFVLEAKTQQYYLKAITTELQEWMLCAAKSNNVSLPAVSIQVAMGLRLAEISDIHNLYSEQAWKLAVCDLKPFSLIPPRGHLIGCRLARDPTTCDAAFEEVRFGRLSNAWGYLADGGRDGFCFVWDSTRPAALSVTCAVLDELSQRSSWTVSAQNMKAELRRQDAAASQHRSPTLLDLAKMIEDEVVRVAAMYNVAAEDLRAAYTAAYGCGTAPPVAAADPADPKPQAPVVSTMAAAAPELDEMFGPAAYEQNLAKNKAAEDKKWAAAMQQVLVADERPADNSGRHPRIATLATTKRPSLLMAAAPSALAPGSGQRTLQPVCLLIIDGWGLSGGEEGNAVACAPTPNMDRLCTTNAVELEAAGQHVGLAEGWPGGSQIGHLNIGAGRAVVQDAVRVDAALIDDGLQTNLNLIVACNTARSRDGRLHVVGMLSDAGVQAHTAHLLGLLRAVKQLRVPRIYIHAITDGVDDMDRRSGIKSLIRVLEHVQQNGYGELATITGSYYAMNGTGVLERTKVAYEALVGGIGEVATSESLVQLVRARYAEGELDAFIKPIILCPEGRILEGDVVVTTNFRGDNMRQLVESLAIRQPFKSSLAPPTRLHVCCMTQYGDSKLPSLFQPVEMKNSLGEVLSKNGLRQWRCAQSSKYENVTYFFNGCRKEPFVGQKGERVGETAAAEGMGAPLTAYALAKKVTARLEKKKDVLIVANVSAPDVAAHSGVMQWAVDACAATDVAIGEIETACRHNGFVLMVTADHGNAEKMVDEAGCANAEHTANRVPFASTGRPLVATVQKGRAALRDVAPTVLDQIGLRSKSPTEMTGVSLLPTPRFTPHFH